MKTYTVKQSDLTSDCWLIQIQGIEACKECEAKGTKDCGGINILAQMDLGKYPRAGIGKRLKPCQ